MKEFERITVLFEESGPDRDLMLYVRELARACGTKEVELLSVILSPPSIDFVDVPFTGTSYWVNRETAHERDLRVAAKREELVHMARELMPKDAGFEVKTEVLSGSPLYETLAHTLREGTDLIAVGRGFSGNGTSDKHATMARRLTRKAACSVLVVPERSFELPTRLLVPVRDSECSARALETACGLAASTHAMVFAVNVHPKFSRALKTPPPGQAPLDLPDKAAEDENTRLSARVDNSGVEVEYLRVSDPDDRPADLFLAEIERLCAHAVVIGARGRTGAAGVLLGKITEKLISHASVPVLAVKKKGETVGLLEAILSLARK